MYAITTSSYGPMSSVRQIAGCTFAVVRFPEGNGTRIILPVSLEGFAIGGGVDVFCFVP